MLSDCGNSGFIVLMRGIETPKTKAPVYCAQVLQHHALRLGRMRRGPHAFGVLQHSCRHFTTDARLTSTPAQAGQSAT